MSTPLLELEDVLPLKQVSVPTPPTYNQASSSDEVYELHRKWHDNVLFRAWLTEIFPTKAEEIEETDIASLIRKHPNIRLYGPQGDYYVKALGALKRHLSIATRNRDTDSTDLIWEFLGLYEALPAPVSGFLYASYKISFRDMAWYVDSDSYIYSKLDRLAWLPTRTRQFQKVIFHKFWEKPYGNGIRHLNEVDRALDNFTSICLLLDMMDVDYAPVQEFKAKHDRFVSRLLK